MSNEYDRGPLPFYQYCIALHYHYLAVQAYSRFTYLPMMQNALQVLGAYLIASYSKSHLTPLPIGLIIGS